jgi:hypothetical protein
VQGCVQDLCAEKARAPGKKELSKVQQGCLASRETEVVVIDLGMSMAVSKGPLADRQRPSQGEARFIKVILQGKQDMLTQSR